MRCVLCRETGDLYTVAAANISQFDAGIAGARQKYENRLAVISHLQHLAAGVFAHTGHGAVRPHRDAEVAETR